MSEKNEPTTVAGREVLMQEGVSDFVLPEDVAAIEREAVDEWLASEEAARALAEALRLVMGWDVDESVDAEYARDLIVVLREARK